MDEHRIGLKPILHRVWTFPGVRPLAPVQHRYDWRYLVAFVHPPSGQNLWHLATSVSTELFSIELDAFAHQAGASVRHELVLVLDHAGWHTSAQVAVPRHVHLLFLPPYSPELNPAEHLWRLSDTVLSNRHFATIDALEEAQLERCAVLQRRRDLVRSTTCFYWWPRQIHKLQQFIPR
jgi:transposase